jgi:hypothetical protein
VALTDSGRTLSVVSPELVTASSSSIVIQLKALNRDAVLAAIGKPADALSSVAPVVFNAIALFPDGRELDSFTIPVTVSYTYADEDIAGITETSLSMYHYRDGTWSQLDACSVSVSANTITCTAPHFSIFAIFGSAAESARTPRSGTSIQARVQNLNSLGMTESAEALKREWHWLFPETAHAASVATTAVRDLELGMEGEDVRRLQILLNANGHPLAAAGVGAPGNETTYFGRLTQQALAAYQRAAGVAPTVGYFGPRTRAAMTTAGIAGRWW